MRIHAEEIQKMYKDFFKAEKDQIEINEGLRQAFVNFSNLDKFQGEGAAAAKAYIGEVHTAVLDGFDSALMELEIRMLKLEEDFRSSVDSSDVAIIDCNYIQTAFKNKVDLFRKSYKEIWQAGEDAIKDIDFLGLEPVKLQMADNYLKEAYDYAEQVIKSVSNYPSGFDARHAHDLDQITNTFLPAIDKGLAYMKSLRKNNKIVYTAGEISSQASSWYGDLNAYTLSAYVYALDNDKAALDGMYLEMATDTTMYMKMLYLKEIAKEDGTDLKYEDFIKQMHEGSSGMAKVALGTEIGKTGVDTVAGSYDFAQFLLLVRTGLKFDVNTHANGNVFLNITSVSDKTLSNAERLKALQKLGVDISKVKSSTLSKLFSDGGICVASDNVQTYTHIFDDTKADWKALAALKTALKSDGDFAGALAKAGPLLTKISKKVSAVGLSVDLATDTADAAYDDRTKTMSRANIDGAHLAGDYSVDVGQYLATTVGADALAGAIGGPVGVAVGAAIGLTIVALNVITYGEPSESVMDHVKDAVGNEFEEISHDFQKWFW